MSGLLYEMNKARTDDLVREGERQRLASAAAPTKRPAPMRGRHRLALWPFGRVPRIGRAPRSAAVAESPASSD